MMYLVEKLAWVAVPLLGAYIAVAVVRRALPSRERDR